MINKNKDILTIDEFIKIVSGTAVVTQLSNLKLIRPNKVAGMLENTIKVDDMTFCYCSDFIFPETDAESINYFNDIGFDINMGTKKLVDSCGKSCGLDIILNILSKEVDVTNFNKVLTPLADKIKKYGSFIAYLKEVYPFSRLVMDTDTLDTCTHYLIKGYP